MKIYFAGSIRGGRGDQELYFQIIKEIQKYGDVLTEHVGDKDLNSEGEVEKTDEYIFTRDMEWVSDADLIIAEVSTPSLGVGYEIGRAEAMDKKVFCLYRHQESKKLSAMLTGNKSVKIFEYQNFEDVQDILANNIFVK